MDHKIMTSAAPRKEMKKTVLQRSSPLYIALHTTCNVNLQDKNDWKIYLSVRKSNSVLVEAAKSC